MPVEFGCVSKTDRIRIETQASKLALHCTTRRRGVFAKKEQLRLYTAAQVDWLQQRIVTATHVDNALLQYVRAGAWRTPSRLVVEWCVQLGAAGTAAFTFLTQHRRFWTATWLLMKGAVPGVPTSAMRGTWPPRRAWSRHEKQAFAALCKRLPAGAVRESWQHHSNYCPY